MLQLLRDRGEDFGGVLATEFVKHVRGHVQQPGRLTCRGSVQVVMDIVEEGNLYQAFKDKEVLHFLFDLMPGLYQDEPKSLVHRFHRGTTTTKNFNFNQLVAQHQLPEFTDSSSRRSPLH